jgi:hypothetical protein
MLLKFFKVSAVSLRPPKPIISKDYLEFFGEFKAIPYAKRIRVMGGVD